MAYRIRDKNSGAVLYIQTPEENYLNKLESENIKTQSLINQLQSKIDELKSLQTTNYIESVKGSDTNGS